MIFTAKGIVALALASITFAVPAPLPGLDASKFTQPLIDNGAVLKVLAANALVKSLALAASNPPGSCTLDKVRYRREWRSLSKTKRKEYIAAVKCLRTSPSLFNSTFMPGSKSLYDTFVGVHLLQTPFIHLTGTFLTWHRYFMLEYEERLNQCGYNGDLPYWEWGLDVDKVEMSPLFDGSDTSLGGNGVPFPHAGMQILFPGATETIFLPPGSGGGCVLTGPFPNLSVSLGPVAVQDYGSTNQISVPNPLLDNTRCLKRDLNNYVLKHFSSFRNTTDVIINYNTIELFQAFFQGDPRYIAGQFGVHGGGHYTMGGDPGSDPFISPGDPAFFAHHSQVDRIYWIWQMQDFANRQGVFGTGTLMNVPPSPNVTVDDTVDLGPLAGPIKMKELMNTVGNTPLCYVYI